VPALTYITRKSAVTGMSDAVPQARHSASNHDSTTPSYPIAIKLGLPQVYMEHKNMCVFTLPKNRRVCSDTGESPLLHYHHYSAGSWGGGTYSAAYPAYRVAVGLHNTVKYRWTKAEGFGAEKKIMGAGKVLQTFSQSASALVPAEGHRYP
jgi:hypothetical protein